MNVAADPVRLRTHAFELLQAGRPDVALLFLERAVAGQPADGEALAQLAMLLERRGEVLRAEQFARRLLRLRDHPQRAVAHLVLGNLARRTGRRSEAIRAYQAALMLAPAMAEATANLGATLVDVGRNAEAMPYLQAATAQMPQSAEVWFNLATVLEQLDRRAEAVPPLLQALERRPDLGPGWNLLGKIAVALGQHRVAEICFVEAAQVQPGTGSPVYNLGLVLQESGRAADAVRCFRRALELDPGLAVAEGALCHQLQFLCAWDEVAVQAARVVRLVRQTEAHVVEPFSLLSIPGATAADHAKAGRVFARRYAGAAPPLVPPGHDWADGRQRLRIGYLCADFREHPMGRLMADTLALHDHAVVETVAVTYGADDHSALRQRILASFDAHLDLAPYLKQSVEEAARAVAALRLDVLIDLQCFTRNAEVAIPARRPAPLQVQFLALPGTSGCDFYDYAIADGVVAAPPVAASYTERLLRLDPCYYPFHLLPADLPAVSRAECGLPEEAIVFACFNQPYKISEESFDAWCQVLQAVPNGVLWLLEPAAETRQRLLAEAARRGVAPDRLVFAPPVANRLHLARVGLADVSLDSWPYNAHTTAVDALLRGVPLVTLPGETFPARVAASILHSLGLGELVAASVAEFVSLAVALATDEAFARAVRAKLATATARGAVEQRMRGYVRNLEQQLMRLRGWSAPADAPQPVEGEGCDHE